MRDPNFRNIRLADLEWLVMPPVLAGQCRLAHAAMPSLLPSAKAAEASKAKSKENDVMLPVAVALWASVSPSIDKRLSTTLDAPVILRPHEWRSGEHLWLMAVAGDPRAVPTFIGQLEAQEFKDKDVRLRARAADGKTEILTLPAFRERKAQELRRRREAN
jgi:hemolysin-activating ACP:hemolysin acyltransferase